MPADHCCRLCGATRYRPVMVHEDGGLRATGLFRCAGCSVVFEDPSSWREAGPDCSPSDARPAPPPRPQVITPLPMDLKRYGGGPTKT